MSKAKKPSPPGKPRKKNSRPARPPSSNLEGESLTAVVERLGIDPDWDFLIVGDGSGSNWNRECAWASVSIEKATGERLVWYGYANRGSVNYAEVKAYEQPLTYVAGREADRVKQGGRRKALQVHIVTDSEYVETVGKSDADYVKNGALWEQFNCFARHGLVLNWHWIRRNTVGLHAYVDRLSKLARTCYKQYNLQERMAVTDTGEPFLTVYEVNPDD